MISGDKGNAEMDLCLSLVTRPEMDRWKMRPEIGLGTNSYERGIECWRKAKFEGSYLP